MLISGGEEDEDDVENLRRTSISFSSDSSLPLMPFLLMHFTATNFPLSDRSSAKMTSENAPLQQYTKTPAVTKVSVNAQMAGGSSWGSIKSPGSVVRTLQSPT